MKKKTKAPTGAACKAVVSGGALACVLHGEHAIHSTSTDGRKARQYATWSTGEDGRIRVITYSSGKKMSEWFEGGELVHHPPAPSTHRPMTLDDEPEDPESDAAAFAAGAVEPSEDNNEPDEPRTHMRCGARRAGVPIGCQLFAGHVGDHFACLMVDAGESNHGDLARAWNDGDEDSWGVCGARWSMHPSEKGPKRRTKSEQTICLRPEEHEGQHRGFSHIGNHMDEWDGDGGKGGSSRPKTKINFVAELLGKGSDVQDVEPAAAESSGHVTSCGYCDSPLEDDGVCAVCLTGKTPFEIKKEAKATPKILGYRRHPAAALFELLEGEELAALADSIKANGQRDPIVLVTVGGETFILDGSNRGLACEFLNIKPRTVHYEGPKDMASLVNYSMDKNRHRRHQEPSVLAMVAIDAAQLGQGNPGNRETGRSAGLMTQAEAGARLGISERLVRRAKVVRDKGTAKVNEAVRKGKMAVEAAEQVTRLPRAKQDEIADEALARKKGAVKSGRVRALVKQEEKRATVRKINEQRVAPMPGGEFGVIYGDYPWKYENSDQHDGSRGHMDYPPMEMDAILAHAREAATRAAKNCILALWVTNLYIPQIGRVVEAYGAEHHTMWTWPKPKAGVGTWSRGQTEHLVIASIGEPVHTLNEISTLLKPYAQREPGRKPDEVAELLRKHCSGPFLELFAREPRSGWANWGAETTKFATEAA